MSDNNRQHEVTITLQSLSAFIGAMVGLIALLVVLAPKTPYHIGTTKPLVVTVIGIVTLYFSLIFIFRIVRRGCFMLPTMKAFKSTPTPIIFSIALIGVAIFTLLIIWNPPSERQIARQILNNRGMHLTRGDYMTALEIGDQDAIVLFHEAGFSPGTAFTWLGAPAETYPDRLSAYVLLTINEDESVPGDLSSLLNLELIDTPIVAKVENNERRSRVISENGAVSDDLYTLLTTKGISLLGYAVLWEQREAVKTLLDLGADLRVATVPLLHIGELPPGSELLAVDPFLYVLNDDDQEDQLVVLNENNKSDRFVEMLLRQGYHPSLFSDPNRLLVPNTERNNCLAALASVGLTSKFQRLVGYRRTGDGYSVTDLPVKECVVSNGTGQIDGSVRFVGMDEDSVNELEAVLRVAVWRGEPGETPSDAEYYAWMTGSSVDSRSASGPWLHYTGSFVSDVGLLRLSGEMST